MASNHAYTGQNRPLFSIGNFSLKFLFITGFCFMFIGLLLVGGTAMLKMKQAADASDKYIEDVVPEMHHTMMLQVLISQTAMPANDWLIHANPNEQGEYRSLVRRVEQRFDMIEAMPTLLPKQRQALATAQQLWIKARSKGDRLMAIASPIGDPAAAVMMEEYDAQLDNAIVTLEGIYDIVVQEAEVQHEILQSILRKNMLYFIIFSSIGLLLMLLGSILLARTVMGSLELMQQGVKAFGKSHFDHRVPLNMPTELAAVAEGLNDMAAKLNASYEKLEQYSYEDALTCSFNKRKLDQDIRSEMARIQRYGGLFSVLMLDLDHFKQVNDRYGHQSGDNVLKEIVSLTNSQLREVDTMYRYGGEEFVIILPKTGKEGAVAVAERIRQTIANTELPVINDQYISLTVSIGVATSPDDSTDAIGLISVADKYVYAAKAQGRNQVVHT